MIAPLDWGLGHATRCIPIINGLLQQGYQVFIAAEGAQAAMLQQEFPALTMLPIKGYRIKYSKKRWLLPIKILVQIPQIFRAIQYEQQWLKKTVAEKKIDLIISDNRYGLYHSTIPSLFITHQLTIKAPFVWIENILRLINYRYINRFTACWVPDMSMAPGVAGVLSHPQHFPVVPVHYLNVLSRFTIQPQPKQYSICILLSGPEPQRTILEQKLLREIHQLNEPVLLVRGKPLDNYTPAVPLNVTVVNHLNAQQLGAAIQQSEYILCRSGYTTVMELLSLKKKMMVIPTPLQTEQEYIGAQLMKNKVALCFQQKNFNITAAYRQAKAFQFNTGNVLLFQESTIHQLIQQSINKQQQPTHE